MLQAFVGRDVRPAAHLLFFASPKQRRQKKGDPTGRVPSLRCGQPAMLAPGAVLRNSLRAARFVQTTAASQCTKHGHAALPMPAPDPALLGTARGDPTATRAIAALGPEFPYGAERSDGPLETPWGCACGAALAGWRVHRRMHALRALTRRGCLNGARQRAVSSAAHPASAVTQVCPVATRRGRRLGGAFFCLLFLCAQEKEVRRRAHIPASESQQKPLHIEQQRTNPTPQPLTPTLSPKGRGSKTTPKDRESTLNRGSKR